MRKFLSPFLFLALAVAAVAGPYDGWLHYRDVTLNTVASGGGANVAGTVSNFPVLVRLTNASNATGADVLAEALSDGSDLRFTNAAGSAALSYEIERWTSAAAEVWVLVPSVAGNATTTIRLWWGKSDAVSASNPGGVFTTGNNFLGVWHLGNATGISARPNAVTGAPSATPSNNNAAFGGGAGSYVIPNGMIGKADTLRGGGTRAVPTANSDFLNIGSQSDSSAATNYLGRNTHTGYSDFTGGYTFSVWTKPATATIAAWTYISELATSEGASNNLQVFRPTGAATLRHENLNGASTGGGITSGSNAFVANTWTLLAVTAGTGSTPAISLYKDGASIGSGTSSQPIPNVLRTNAWLGKSNYTTDGYYSGSLDEARFSRIARSADWIKLEYETQKSSVTAVALAASQSTLPTKPSIASVLAGNSKAFVTWTAPVSDGGLTITGYTVAASPGGATCNWTSGPLTCAVSGLSDGQAYTFTVTATNLAGSGPASDPSSPKTPGPAPVISYVGAPFTFAMGVEANQPKVNSGTSATSWSITPNLTANTGLLFNPLTGRIVGTPVYVSPATAYTVTAIDTSTGRGDRVVITVAVTPVGPVIAYPTPQSYPVGSAIATLAPNSTGGAIAGWSISPNLTANTGLLFNTTTGKILGTPVYGTPATNYTVTANGLGGTQGQTVVNIATTSPAPTLSYDPGPYAFAVNAAITPLNKTSASGIITGYSISPNLAVNTGLLFSTTTARIEGTPVRGTPPTDYTITAHGPGGAGTAIVSIATTSPAPTVSYDAGPYVYPVNAPVAPVAKTAASGIITGYTIAPALPAGLTFNPTTGLIAGTPTSASAATDYVITVMGPGGTAKDTVNIATTTAAPTVSYDAGPYSYPVGSPITPIVKTGATGIINGYSVAPALPAGLLFNPSTGRIEGTPTAVVPAADYTVTAHGPGGTAGDTVNIATTSPAPTLAYPGTPLVYPVGSAITPLVKTSATGIITGFSIAPNLTANTGLTFSPSTGRIEGTPAYASPATDYVITVAGPGGTAKDTVNIATTASVPTVSYSSTPYNFPTGTAIVPVGKTAATGIITGYTILPNIATNTGLAFSATTGRIEGIPSKASAPTAYSVTAHGPGGPSATATVTIGTIDYNALLSPTLKTGSCPTLTRYAPPVFAAATGFPSNGTGVVDSIGKTENWSSFPIKPTSAFITGCTNTARQNCTVQNPLTPAQSINCIQVPTGLRAELWASEESPGGLKSIQDFTFDERGRMWAVEPIGYPNTLRLPGNNTGSVTNNVKFSGGLDRILILEDSNGDKVMDKVKVFAAGLNMPQGIEIVNGGVVVTMSPYVVFFPNNNDTAGAPQILWHNMGAVDVNNYDTHGGVNHPTYGLDNWLYGHAGYNNCAAQLPGASSGGTTCGAGRVWRMRHTAFADSVLFQIYGLNGPGTNASGIGQTEDGQFFKSAATGQPHSNYVVARTGAVVNLLSGADSNAYYSITGDRYMWEGSTATDGVTGWFKSNSTASNGHDFYTSRLLPEKYWNRRAFVCEGSTKLCNQDSVVMNGSIWRSVRMPGPVRSNLFASSDAWVAPLAAKTGPDGAIWVLDWYNYLFLHNPAAPSGNGSAWQNHLRAKSRVRIYRIVPEDGSTEPVLNLSNASTAQLVSTLSNSNFLWRKHAQRLLIGKGYSAEMGDLLDSALNHRSSDAAGIDGTVIHAIWTLHGLRRFELDSARWNPRLRTLLLHPAWGVRRNVLLAMPANAISAQAIKAQCAVNDVNAHVRLAALDALIRMSAPYSGAATQVATYRNTDAYSQAAFTAAGTGKVTEIAGTTRPASPTCPDLLPVLGKQAAFGAARTAPRQDLHFNVVPGGLDLLPHGQLESGEFVLQDLRGRVAFRSTYNAASASWSNPSARNLPHDVYFYTFRTAGAVAYRGRISTVAGY